MAGQDIGAARVGLLRAAWRLACCLARVAQGLLVCACAFPFLSPSGRRQQILLFSRRVLRALGIHWVVTGERPQPGPLMLVANHVSWLDILAINATVPVRFVSKADVRHWPVLGWMVACGGTLFIERERRRDAMRVVHQVADALAAGDTVAFFPEGTTGDGHGLLPFHANLLEAAIATRVPAQGLALRYSDAGATVSVAAAYTGDITLWQSLWAVVSARGLTAAVHVLPALPAQACADRRTLSSRLREGLERALQKG